MLSQLNQSIQTAAHAAKHDNVTHTEESVTRLFALFCIHQVTDTNNWLVSLWLTGDKVWHSSQTDSMTSLALGHVSNKLTNSPRENVDDVRLPFNLETTYTHFDHRVSNMLFILIKVSFITFQMKITLISSHGSLYSFQLETHQNIISMPYHMPKSVGFPLPQCVVTISLNSQIKDSCF